MKKLEKGFFLIEGLVALGIFAIFLSITFPLIKNSIKLKKVAEKTTKKHKDYYFIFENIQREIKNSLQIKVIEKGKALKFTRPSFDKNKDIDTIIYRFNDRAIIGNLIRKINQERDEVIFYNVKGYFLNEDNFIKMIISFNLSEEEEYIWK